MLTFEQFKALRAKGLTTQQIVSFEAGNKPEGTTQDISQPKISALGSAIKGAANLPVVKQAGEVGTGVLKGLAEGVDFIGDVGASFRGTEKTPIFGEKITKSNSAWEEIGKLASAFVPIGPKTTPLTAGKSAVGLGANALKGTAEAGKIVLKGTGKTVSQIPAISKARIYLTPMEKYVETALKETDIPTFNRYLEQGKKSILDIRHQTPMSMAGEEAQRALDMIKSQRDEMGNLLGKIKKSVGGNPLQNEIINTINGFKKDISQKFGLIIGDNGSIKTAANRAINISKSDVFELQNAFKDLNSIIDKTKIYKAGSVLGGTKGNVVESQTAILRKADDIITKIQNNLYQRKTNQGVYQLNSDVEGTLKFWLGKLNKGVKEVGGGDYTKAKDEYGQLTSLFNRFNKVLGERGKRGASLMKTIFSPTGEDTRKLLLEIKSRTGIDLANRAALSKFIMEALGDARQKSLLEEVGFPTSKNDLIMSIYNRAKNAVADPIGKAKSILKK